MPGLLELFTKWLPDWPGRKSGKIVISVGFSMKKSSCNWRASDRNRCELIVDAARNHFLSKGFHGVSIRSLAEELNIQPGSIYYHFASKEEILFEIIESYESGLNQALGAIGEGTAVQMLGKYVDAYMNLAFAEHLAAQLARLEFRSLSEKHKAEILELRAWRVSALNSILSRGLALNNFDLLDMRSTIKAIDFVFGGFIGSSSHSGETIAECKFFVFRLLGARYSKCA